MGGGGQGGDCEGAGGQARTAAGGPGTGVGQDRTLQETHVNLFSIDCCYNVKCVALVLLLKATVYTVVG